ncbi:MAG: tetratricopeptide repeat protein [Candidatus Thorarchaeota archaeon]|nr:tetratricopeptide repeat protein [Candidatus Thorarchaeota archaeon]
MPPDERVTHFDYYRAARAHEKSGRYSEALESYARAIALSADYAHAWYYKAQLHLRLGQFDECIKCAERALALQPSWKEHITRLVADAKSKAAQ